MVVCVMLMLTRTGQSLDCMMWFGISCTEEWTSMSDGVCLGERLATLRLDRCRIESAFLAVRMSMKESEGTSLSEVLAGAEVRRSVPASQRA